MVNKNDEKDYKKIVSEGIKEYDGTWYTFWHTKDTFQHSTNDYW